MEQLSLFKDDNSGAVIDSSGKYRYSLWRIWEPTLPRVLFIMLNPSTADHKENDPTIRRCINFAKCWKYGSLEVVNLFAFRATDPDELLKIDDPIGMDNDFHIVDAVKRCEKIVLAWGTNGIIKNRNVELLKLLSNEKLYCLETTKERHPKHPLYVKGDTMPTPFLQL